MTTARWRWPSMRRTCWSRAPSQRSTASPPSGSAGLTGRRFILVLFEGRLTAEAAYRGLMEAGYITRWLPGQKLAHALRISVGTAEETRGLAAALRRLVEAAA